MDCPKIVAVEPLVVLGLYFALLGTSAVDGTPVAVVGRELLETAADSGWVCFVAFAERRAAFPAFVVGAASRIAASQASSSCPPRRGEMKFLLHNDVPVEQVVTAAHQQPGPVARQVRFPMGWRFLVASLVGSFDVRVAHALVDD